jgi:TatD DNase family protein
VKLVDSHCHLDNRKFAEDADAVIARALDAGVERMLAIGTGDGPPDIDAGIRLAERYPFMLATVGVHPHDASKADEETYEALRVRCGHEKVVAFGEIGLDYHYDFAPRETQRTVFIRQLQIAREAGLPVVIHTREAWADTVAILQDHPPGPGIFHCFTGGPAEADDAVALGFHVSFCGVLTFPKADALREAARQVPEDRILVETDAPYLAPVPHRGKRNEPAFVIETVTCLAAVREESPDRMAAMTTANFDRLCLR